MEDGHPSILSGDNSNINIYQGCGVRGDSRQSAGMTTSSAGGGFMRFVFVGGSGYILVSAATIFLGA